MKENALLKMPGSNRIKLWAILVALLFIFAGCRQRKVKEGGVRRSEILSTEGHVDRRNRPALVNSCDVPYEETGWKVFDNTAALLERYNLSRVIFTVTTLGSWPALELQLKTLNDFAPEAKKRFIVFCVGEKACSKCVQYHDKCVPDYYLDGILRGTKGADSIQSDEILVDRTYVDIIWRKPELIHMFLELGISEVVVVDTDGVWFSEPSEFGDSIVSSAEFTTKRDSFVTDDLCLLAPVFRDSPLILNSGTVFVRNDRLGRLLMRDWLKVRPSRQTGLCSVTKSKFRSFEIMLDQDGLNLVACSRNKLYSGRVKVLSSNQVLLNSVHADARRSDWFDLCKPWFFHSTSCGPSDMKIVCMERNLGRRAAKCSTR